MAGWLIDTSALSHIKREPVSRRVAECVVEGASLCDQIVAESQVRAASPADLAARNRFFETMQVWPVDAAVWSRVGTIAEALAKAGRTVATGDAVVAACALINDLTVLHYDSDFEILGEVADLSHEWVVRSGTL